MTQKTGYRDEFGYVYVTARDDDVINVAGHRLPTSTLEDVVLSHPDFDDAAVVGVPEQTKEEIPLCLYIIRNSNNSNIPYTMFPNSLLLSGIIKFSCSILTQQ